MSGKSSKKAIGYLKNGRGLRYVLTKRPVPIGISTLLLVRKMKQFETAGIFSC